MRKVSNFIVVLLILSGVQFGYGQSLKYGKITSASATSSATNGSLRWSLGELTVGNLDEGTAGSLQQGHQWLVQYVPVDKIATIDVKIQVYPNPSTDYLTVQVEETTTSKLLGQLTSLEGNILKEVVLHDFQSTIAIQDLSVGIYFLTIVEEETGAQSTYKLIKQ
ncbi:MAG: T9SS type A sorting domain-containing protein [Aureispira sp.]